MHIYTRHIIYNILKIEYVSFVLSLSLPLSIEYTEVYIKYVICVCVCVCVRVGNTRLHFQYGSYQLSHMFIIADASLSRALIDL